MRERDKPLAHLPPGSVVLVAEDDLLIAMHMEDLLREYGFAECHVVGTAQAALAAIAAQRIDFALLDFGLGDDTSEAPARALQARDIPFAFCTGYDRTLPAAAGFANVPLMGKPFDAADLHACIAATLGAAGVADGCRASG